jgi:hypothetical protein
MRAQLFNLLDECVGLVLTTSLRPDTLRALVTVRSFAPILIALGISSRLMAQGCIGDVNNPSTFFTGPTVFPAGTRPGSVAVGDFNRDGRADVAVATSNSALVLLGNGDGSFQSAANVATLASPQAIAVADFDGNGTSDLITANSSSNDISVMLGNGAGAFSPPAHFPAGVNPFSLAVADFNGDGHPDAAVGNLDGTVSILLGIGDGTFTPATSIVVGTLPNFTQAVLSADFNRDGHPDLAVADGSTNTVAILLGTGTGSFSPLVRFPVGLTPIAITAGDIDGDGFLDLATANVFSNNVTILFGTGTGSFQPALSVAFNSIFFGGPFAIAYGDYNNDGHGDLAVANNAISTIAIIFGGPGRSVLVPPARFFTGVGPAQPSGLAAADLNRDGRLDLVAANPNTNDVGILINVCNPIILPTPALSSYALVALAAVLAMVAARRIVS